MSQERNAGKGRNQPYTPTPELASLVESQRHNRPWREYGESIGVSGATLHAIAHRRPGACSRHTAEQIRRALMPAWVGRAADALTERRKAAQ